jgi:hypothetical protein
MVQGYYPVIKALAENLDIRLNHRHATFSQTKKEEILTHAQGRN